MVRLMSSPSVFKVILTSPHLIGVEYWQNPDPSSPATVKKCAPDGEDPTCSDSIPDKVIQSKTTLEAHLYVSFFSKNLILDRRCSNMDCSITVFK